MGKSRQETALSGWLLLWDVPCSCLPEARARKLGEAVAVDVHRERAEAGDQHVEAKVELLATDDVRIGDVALDHIRYRLCGVVPSEEQTIWWKTDSYTKPSVLVLGVKGEMRRVVPPAPCYREWSKQIGGHTSSYAGQGAV